MPRRSARVWSWSGQGEVIGTAMWWNYGQAYATAGMIIVTGSRKAVATARGSLMGCLRRRDGRNVLLNSTDEGLALYKRRGFTAWGTVLQHQGWLTVAVTQNARDDIRQATVSDLAAIQAFDERATGMPRPSMVAALADVGKVVVVERARADCRLRHQQEVRPRLCRRPLRGRKR